MRLIDADALREALVKWADMARAKNDWGAHGAVSNAIVMMDNTPSVDVVPVAQGRWIAIEANSVIEKCSACGEKAFSDAFAKASNCGAIRYCPCCGAKME